MSMSTSATSLLVIQGNVLGQSLAVDRPQSSAPAAPAERDEVAFELANASMLASALGFGVYIDTFV